MIIKTIQLYNSTAYLSQRLTILNILHTLHPSLPFEVKAELAALLMEAKSSAKGLISLQRCHQ